MMSKFCGSAWPSGYAPIEEHGIIGNMHTVAVVSTDATIDFMCYPEFDSPSVFASILDKDKGGYFAIRGRGDVVHKQFYHPNTNVLLTRFLGKEGVAQVVDFMPLGGKYDDIRRHWLIREIECVRGEMTFLIACCPAFNYGRDTHTTTTSSFTAEFKSKTMSAVLHSSCDMPWSESCLMPNGIKGAITLKEGERHLLVFRQSDDTGKPGVPGLERPFPMNLGEALKHSTFQYWRKWIGKCKYTGRWREMVERSALALKLLTYEPTGAIIAAATTSLPETLGGSRNWDYRYTWIRDSAFTLYAFMRLGFTEEANKFICWIEARCKELSNGKGLQIMYGIRGEHDLTEHTLDHLEGYKRSGPVRIGNGAFDQLQLDIYGELLDTIYLANKYARPISYEFWRHVRSLVDWVCANWTRQDEGIWEIRSGKQSFTYSRIMSWVAVDRGIRLAEKRSFPSDLTKWRQVRDAIYEDIQVNAYDPERGAFMQYYGSKSLDAANLIMPMMFFMSPADPRFLKTLDATLKSTGEGGLVSNNLVFRYNVDETDDGLDGEEGTFSICTFWAVEALSRAGKYDRAYLEKSLLMFEQTIGYANHLGLFSEEIGSEGQSLGNFPQAFTHLALISAAFSLDRTLNTAK